MEPGATLPRSFFVPGFGNCYLNTKGYPRIYSKHGRGKYLHRAVWESIAGTPVPEGFHVHHTHSKFCWAPETLVALQDVLHVHTRRRDPYTGEPLTRDEWARRYGFDNGRGV